VLGDFESLPSLMLVRCAGEAWYYRGEGAAGGFAAVAPVTLAPALQ
jgi:hypothetical protein